MQRKTNADHKARTANVQSIDLIADGGGDWSSQRRARTNYGHSIEALDELIDSGAMSEPVRGFPPKFFRETVEAARKLAAEHGALTALRCAELAISKIYQRHQYQPSWNAPYFAEREIAAAM